MAPRCAEAAPGDPILILGLGWPSKPVELAAVTGGATTQLGTVDPRASPVSQQPGSFTVVATITAGTGGFRVTGTQGDLTRSASVGVDSSCGARISVKPPCLGSPGPVQVTGTEFGPGESVEIDVDPFGDAEARPPAANADRTGTFTTTISLRVARFADGPAVNAQIGPDGRAVTSVCVPHDAGNVLGPVAVLVSIGSFGPAPLFRVLRVPARPQPPLLQAGADTRRS